ncbi:37S ribosomal protein S9, mitochondrial [Saxophila tyrrhenica]|uniref:Small ribosomal subunit protein uS9m n=1 Tax=Saxophila tyrrhenica TaxID=1690608 RepID=A0AAV9NWX4_9PEZI|nr:37S ribosomal protein S9, mitochondrial [Saxophila tyrrhenica]
METTLLRAGFRRAIASSYNPARRRVLLLHASRRTYASPSEPSGPIQAARPINFTSDTNQFARSTTNSNKNTSQDQDYDRLLHRVRIVPASPSYFTATPRYTDDLLYLSSLYRKYQLLPRLAPGTEPRVAWKTLAEYRTETGEPVRQKGYTIMLSLLKRLNKIHTALLPVEVQRALQRYKRRIQPFFDRAKPIEIDELGRARAVGRRKACHAVVFLVEGEGECLINGRSLTEYFGRLHDRESAVWPLKATQRLDKYNVWAVAKGGGTTGQAEAITLGLAKALLAHEPDLKEALRRAGCVTRDPRRVERKKAGKLKARKMPAWVKR